MTLATVFNNEFEWVLRGEVDLNASAAVTAVRGTNFTVVKTGTGTYTVTLKNTSALQIVEILHRDANFSGSSLPATATGVTLTTVTQNLPNTSDVVITLVTTANPTTGAATDTTAACTIDFEAVLRIGRLVSPI